MPLTSWLALDFTCLFWVFISTYFPTPDTSFSFHSIKIHLFLALAVQNIFWCSYCSSTSFNVDSSLWHPLLSVLSFPIQVLEHYDVFSLPHWWTDMVWKREVIENKGLSNWSHVSGVIPRWHIFHQNPHQNQRRPLFPQNISLSLAGCPQSPCVNSLHSHSVLFYTHFCTCVTLAVKVKPFLYEISIKQKL